MDHISFEKSKNIFGPGFDRFKSDECRFFPKLMPYLDGKGKPILETVSGLEDKKHLWAYVYYLAKNNPGHAYLSKMVHEGKKGTLNADARAMVGTVCEYLGKPLDEAPNLTVPELAQFAAHMWDIGVPTVPYLNNLFAYVLEKLKAEDKNTGKAYEQLQENIEHVKNLTSRLQEMGTTTTNHPPTLVVSPSSGNDPYETMGKVNLQVVLPSKDQPQTQP